MAAGLHITRYDNRSFYMHVLHALVKPFKPKLVSSSKTYPAESQRIEPHSKARKLCNIEERQIEGIYVYDMTAKTNPEKSIQRRVYYIAGGGWQAPPSPEHWKLCTQICQNVPNTAVSIVSPPLAPNNPASTAFPQLMKFYDAILTHALDSNEKIIMAGDSSGGNLVLSLVLQRLSEPGHPRHADAVFAICPAVDLKQMPDEGQYKAVNKNDPILTLGSHNGEVKQWSASIDPAEPWISPINADVSALARAGVRLFGVTGGYDILAPDALVFRDKCQAAGVQGEWLHWEKQMHCFPLAYIYGLRESVQCKDWILDRIWTV